MAQTITWLLVTIVERRRNEAIRGSSYSTVSDCLPLQTLEGTGSYWPHFNAKTGCVDAVKIALRNYWATKNPYLRKTASAGSLSR